MGIEGENLKGVYGANELLEYGNYPDFTDKEVIINGGGNVAIDIARVIKRKNAKKVTIVYRRDKEQMPAEEKEVQDAENEGIELIKTELIKKEGDTRLSPVNISGSNYLKKADYVIMALGSKLDDFVKDLGLELTDKDYIKVDENLRTSNPKIYAGGDVIGKEKTVAHASRNGRDVANKMMEDFCK